MKIGGVNALILNGQRRERVTVVKLIRSLIPLEVDIFIR